MECSICGDRGVFSRWSIELPGGSFIEPDEHEAKVVDGVDTTPEGVPYWAPGNPIRYLHGDPAWVEQAPCSCTAVVSDYEDRKEARADRREARAERMRDEAVAETTRAREMLPDFGQPILVGHHSERGHRRLLERSDSLMRSGIGKARKAQRLEGMADRARGRSEISSEDTHAPAKLRARAWRLDWRRDNMKARNAKARKAGQPAPHESWELRNASAESRRLRKRADEIEAARRVVVPEDLKIGDFRVTWDSDDNRVRVYSPRPSADQRQAQSKAMRQAGFKWARSVGCWQRHASRPAWDAAARVVEALAVAS